MHRAVALSIPSPGNGVWHLGPVPLRGYAFAIILGVVVAIWIAERRWEARGGTRGEVADVAVWAVPFGLVGARLYHVATDPDRYFGSDGSLWAILYVWRGGLGVWGAIALGAVGVVVACRLRGIKVLPMIDAMAPGVLVAQAFGRWGNWFNQELYGRPTDLPWGLEIDPANYPSGRFYPPGTTFHPTFLYESLWCLLAAAVLVWADRRWQIGHGRVVALYVMLYTVERGLVENLRVDTVQLDDVLGLRLNVWTSIVLFTVALAYFLISRRRRPGRETEVYREPRPGVPATETEGPRSEAL
jgi:prolipoprotein diacylglyceryl transferase